MRDRPAAAAENLDVICAAPLQLPDDFGKKLDVPAVVTRDPDRAHVLLDRGPDDVLGITVIPEINHLDSMPDELEVDRVDRAVVPVANRNGGENADGCNHRSETLALIACRAI